MNDEPSHLEESREIKGLDERSESEAFSSPRVVIITGLSGSGKSTAIRALEDVGFFCIDNLPVPLLPKVLELANATEQRPALKQLAFVVDTRDSLFLDQADATVQQLRDEGVNIQVFFLHADPDVLVRRYSETRRRHPLSRGGTVREGIEREGELLAPLRSQADALVDTTHHTVHTLKAFIQEEISHEHSAAMGITLLSFGYKYGLPIECDLVFDLRFLPNPYFVETLREKTGMNEDVQHYVLGFEETERFLALFEEMAAFMLPMYEAEGKSYLTIGIGCTGGRHRSVTVVETLSTRLRQQGWSPNVRHRDIQRA